MMYRWDNVKFQDENYVTCSQAEDLAEGLATGGKTSRLMFGIQWDLVLKYLEVSENWDTTENEASYYLKTNSSSWGNYRDVDFPISEGNKYAIYSNSNLGEWDDVPANYTKPANNSSGNGVLLSSRGANFSNNSAVSSSSRAYTSTSLGNNGIGFRPALY